MTFTVKHSLPGRIRIRYDKSKITRQQAALAQSLLSVQEGMTDVSVNYTTGSFLVFYDVEKLSEKHIKAYFSALSEKYLNNQEMLESIGEPREQESLLFNLAVMTVMHYVKQILPLPIRILLRVYSLAPRILKGAELITSGKIFKSEVLDAAAISMALVNKDIKTAANINFLLNIGDIIEDFTKKKSYSDLADRLLSQNDQVQKVEGKTERTVPLSAVKKGDLIAVRTGNVIPVDGTVMRGEGLVNQASITGEPIAVLSAMKEAAENGIIVKGGKFLEDASIADTVVFDKTGTLTAATPAVSRIITFGGRKEDDVLATAACLEEHFAHPVAAAVVKAANERGLLHPENHAKVEYIVAHGIATTLKGKKLVIGSRHFVFDDEKVQEPEELKKIQKDALKNGESLLYLAEEKELIGIFAVNDPVRKNAPEIIQKLHQSGIKNCVMITGDDEGAARNAAKITKIDHYISRALPEDKFNYIEKQKKLGHKVIMIGDGINDAPALAAADTGIAMGDCADITGETADIILSSEDGLEGLYKTRLLGTGLMRKIDVNNGGIVAVNTTFMLLGLFGFISPSLAAILHNASTVAFSVNAMRPVLAGKEGA